MRSLTRRPLRQSENTVPLSMPSRLPPEMAMTSRGPPAVKVSATASTRSSGFGGLGGRRMRDELQVVRMCFHRDQAIARTHFAAGVLQQQRGGLAGVGGGARVIVPMLTWASS